MLTIHKTIETSSGKLIGKDDGTVTTFLGIPFAKPPIDKLRWKPPKKYTPKKTPIRADSFGNSPIQFSPTKTNLKESEDCLFLNIWKTSAEHSKIPVFIWIYGGGFVSGSSSLPVYNGRVLAKQGIIFVSFNYRLSSLGFMVFKDDGKTDSFNCNYGLKDQLLALEWVKGNIESFGGDPDNITLGGESVGSSSITALLTSTKREKLFHKVILLSGTMETLRRFMPNAYGTSEQVFSNTEKLLSKLNLKDINFNELQKIPIQHFISAKPIDHFFPTEAEFSIAEDDDIFPNGGLEHCIKNNTLRKVPMMLGFTKDEGTIFTSQLLRLSDLEYISWLLKRFDFNFARKINRNFPTKNFQNKKETIELIFKFAGFIIPEIRIADYNSTSQNTYMFSFNRVSDSRLCKLYGAYHSSEIQYFMGNLSEDLTSNSIDSNLSKYMQSIWVEFIKNSPIDNFTLSNWTPYSKKKKYVKIFDENISNSNLNADKTTSIFSELLN